LPRALEVTRGSAAGRSLYSGAIGRWASSKAISAVCAVSDFTTPTPYCGWRTFISICSGSMFMLLSKSARSSPANPDGNHFDAEDWVWLRLVLNRYHPADAEPVFKHSEFRRPKCLLKRHCNLAAVRKRVENSIGFFLVRYSN